MHISTDRQSFTEAGKLVLTTGRPPIWKTWQFESY